MFLGAPTGHAFLLTTARHIIRPAQKGPGPRVSSLRSLHNGGQKRQEILGSPPIVQISTGFLFVFSDGEHTHWKAWDSLGMRVRQPAVHAYLIIVSIQISLDAVSSQYSKWLIEPMLYSLNCFPTMKSLIGHSSFFFSVYYFPTSKSSN